MTDRPDGAALRKLLHDAWQTGNGEGIGHGHDFDYWWNDQGEARLRAALTAKSPESGIRVWMKESELADLRDPANASAIIHLDDEPDEDLEDDEVGGFLSVGSGKAEQGKREPDRGMVIYDNGSEIMFPTMAEAEESIRHATYGVRAVAVFLGSPPPESQPSEDECGECGQYRGQHTDDDDHAFVLDHGDHPDA